MEQALCLNRPGFSALPTLDQSYEQPPYALVHAVGKPLNIYEEHFALELLQLARDNHVKGLPLLHIPIDSEQGLSYMPERSRWDRALTLMLHDWCASNVVFKDLDSAPVP